MLVEKGSKNMDVGDKDQVISQMKAALASRQFGQEDFLSSLVADVIMTSFYSHSVFWCLQSLYFGNVVDKTSSVGHYGHVFKSALSNWQTLMSIMYMM